MWETCHPAALQETLLPWVMLASIPPRKHRSMNRNPAHGWINLTAVRSDERGELVDNSGDIKGMKKTRNFFFSLSDWEKRGQRMGGMRNWMKLTVVVYSGKTLLHLKKFGPLHVWEKARDKKWKNASQKANNEVDLEMAGTGTGLADSH